MPIFMCVFLSILFFIRVIYIQNNVQYALNGAANELSTYSYLYSVSGLQKVNNEIVEITTENSELASDHTVKLLESFDALSENFQEGLESTKQLSEGDLSQIESLKGIYDKSLPPAENVKNVLENAISDPKREFVSIASLFLNSGYEELKRDLAEPLVKFYMKKYIDPQIISSKGGPDSYNTIAKKDGHMYFDMGSAYDDAMKKYNLSTSDMFELFNAPALDDAVMSGKKIRFVNDPEAKENETKAIYLEYMYLKKKYNLRIVKEGEFWYAK